MIDNVRLTYLERFLQYYPKAYLTKNGTPYSVCRNTIIGRVGDCDMSKSCLECWNELEEIPEEDTDDNTGS